MTRKGSAIPTFSHIGDYDASSGKKCIETLKECGIEFDEAQSLELEYMFAIKNGLPAAITFGVSKPRQNGKSYAARWYAVWRACVDGLSVIYSAHNGDTVHEFFDMLADIFTDEENYPFFASELDGKPYRQLGKESITFKSGGRIKFVTRTNSGSRGGTCSVIVIDEAQELTDAQINALLPTMSTGKTPQSIYVGTPPDATCAGTVFSRMHDTAHTKDTEIWWLEWAIDALPDAKTSDAELIELAYKTNPALGIRISEAAIKNEIAQMSIDGFARERLGWWREFLETDNTLITGKQWRACLTDTPPVDGKTAFGIKFSTDGASAAISAAIEDGVSTYVELIDIFDTSTGVGSLANWINERKDICSLCVIDGRSKSAALVLTLKELGMLPIALKECTATDIVSAASLFVSAIEAKEITHIKSDALDESICKSVRRAIGSNGSFSFGDSSETSSAPAESAALAYFGVKNTKRNPRRKAVIW